MEELLIFSDVSSMRQYSRQQRQAGKKIALVPTMFSKNEDFGIYPEAREEDHRKLQAMGCHAVFEPASLYHPGPCTSTSDNGNVVGAGQHVAGAHETFIQVEQLQKPMCGKSRPHFFRGVATIVAKLFNIVEPDVAVFGRKDFQQLQVIRRMVRDLDFDIEIIGIPTGREPDGMALSSRNALLTPEARQQAVCIYQALKLAESEIAGGDSTPAHVQQTVEQCVTQGGGRVDYVVVVDAENLQNLQHFTTGQEVLVAVAAFFGTVRLIDNVVASCKA